MKIWRILPLISAALLASLTVSGQGQQEEPPSARLLTVELFSARTLQALTLTPAGSQGWMRACATCTRTAVRLPVHLTFKAGELRSGTGLHAKSLEFDGSFRAQAGNVPGGTSGETSPIRGMYEAGGQWEIKASSRGLLLLLTMPSERYVTLALNGEAAADEPRESLKAMAIVMRTYALTNATRHAAEGFNLCDSTHCQALRFGKIRPEVLQAEQETSGETLWFGSHRAKAFYTQHCGGVTEDAASAWAGGHVPYLASHADPYCLRRSTSQWHAEISESRMQTIAREQGWRFPPRIERVRVVRSTASGRAALLRFDGAGVQALVSAASLRFAIDRELGWNQLRSDWYAVTLGNDVLHFTGKGYGHGVGLCQTGAYEMAAEGQSSDAILNFYFPGTRVRISPTDSGWRKVEGSGWTLMTAASPHAQPQAALLHAGNAAWGQAQAIFPPHTLPHPIVRVMPTTELFRQSTSEPGWILATARADEISLQPAAVLQANVDSCATLRHEFLHVLVEQEAASGTALWLREGLVEALASSGRRSREQLHFDNPADIDAALADPRDQRVSEGAHDASQALVKQLIARYGLGTVRGWLRSGIPEEIVRNLSQY